MIHSIAFDVEVFPNLFSVTFVSIKEYNETFKDCVDEKNKAIPLTEKLAVKEIKERLDKINTKIFYISDTDDSQLLELVAYFNNMEAHYENVTDSNGGLKQIPVRTDCFGFNILGYDNYMIKAFLMYFNRFDSTKYLIEKLYSVSKKIIDLQKVSKEAFYADKELDLIRHYKLPYASVDVQKIFALHAASVKIDKDGNRIKMPKSLKQTSINLKWHELLDFTLPPIDEEEANIYWRKKDFYKGCTVEYLNSININEFDRYVLPKYIEPMLYYNRNDVFLVCEIARQKPDEIRLRYAISSAYKINVLSDSRANIADKLIADTYAKRTNLRKEAFENLRTERTVMSFKNVIFPHIAFKTEKLQNLLRELKEVKLYHVGKDSFSKEIEFDGTIYQMATGGLHSKDVPGVYISNDKYTYVHEDVSSFYPSIMIAYKISPKHLIQKIFTPMVRDWRDWRVEAKHTDDSVKQVVPGVPNNIAADALKIVINAIFGKFGSDTYFLYDRLALLQTTINGQLMALMLIEELSLNGIRTISANTDGIIVKLPKDKEDVCKNIIDNWCAMNKMGMDGEHYSLLVSRDVNNYLVVHKNGKIEFKGALNPKMYIKDLTKGYDMPIVAKAVYEYFVNNVPIMTTLETSKDILDFCKTQNIGRNFEVANAEVKDGKLDYKYTQRHNRFYVSTKGSVLIKEEISTGKKISLLSGKRVQILNSLDDKPIEERNIDYKYYYDEAYKIIDPIKLRIPQNLKPNAIRKTSSGKKLIKKYSKQYLTLFDNDEE